MGMMALRVVMVGSTVAGVATVSGAAPEHVAAAAGGQELATSVSRR
jgi:hypothetical protein